MKLGPWLAISSCLMLMACSSSFKSEFKQGCRELGGNRSFCSCSYKNVEQHYGKKTLEQIKTSGLFPSDWAEQVQRAGMACMAELK